MWQALVAPFLNFIGKPIAAYQENKKIVIEATAKRKAREQESAIEWENNVLTKSGVFLRWVCAIHLFAGMDYTIYAVATEKDAHLLWQALELMPDWYTGLLATMFGFAFASKGLKSVGGALASTWKNRSAQKRLDARTNVSGGAIRPDLKYGNTEK